MLRSYSIPNIVLRELEKPGVSWRVDVGGKHGKLIVNGKLAGIVRCGAGGGGGDRAEKNLRAQVRRALVK